MTEILGYIVWMKLDGVETSMVVKTLRETEDIMKREFIKSKYRGKYWYSVIKSGFPLPEPRYRTLTLFDDHTRENFL